MKASLVEVRSQEIISLVEESPSVYDGQAPNPVYFLWIIARVSGVNIRSAENQQQAGDSTQEAD